MESRKRMIEEACLGFVCLVTLCGILVAGLWPFCAPRNQVSWVKADDGLRFGDHGTILSSGTFKMKSSRDERYSLEIWLQPGLTNDANTFLAFYTPENPLQFSLHQSTTDLELRTQRQSEHHEIRKSSMLVDDVFHQGKSVFITIVSGAQGTAVYIDGALVKTSSQFWLSSNDFTGQLVVGDSPVSSDSWSGELLGLAIYNRKLTAAQVSKHYEVWTKKGKPDVAPDDRSVEIYLFNEHTGNIVRNQAISGIDLYIPQKYQILDQIFLERPWKEFHSDWGYWKNVLINIGGFVPLGFFFCAYFSSVRQIKRAALITIIVGAIVSLTIEVLQAFLPTRQSGMTDLITNTLGTSLGVVLWHFAFMREGFTKVCIALARVSTTSTPSPPNLELTREEGLPLARLPRS
jgi:hypothetical protein